MAAQAVRLCAGAVPDGPCRAASTLTGQALVQLGDAMVEAATVRAVNDMTARWARRAVGQEGTVLTAAGVWPLLALLAGPAAGAARKELADAVGSAPEDAAAQGRAFLAALDATDGVDGAVGLWTRAALPLRPEWQGGLPLETHGELTGDAAADRQALDGWARRHTAGLIERMPVTLSPQTLFVLASALLVRTTWTGRFHEFPLRVAEGPWAGRELTGLRRHGTDPERIRAYTTGEGPLTRVEVAGDNGLDVHLLLGPPPMPGGAVLHHGIAAAAGAYPGAAGTELTEASGPGLTVTCEPSRDGAPRARLTTVRFTVDADHDLLSSADVFGLATATDGGRGHFPGISPRPLAVSSARQTATATFGPVGFRAAAVTALALRAGAAPPPTEHRSTVVAACYDRPFGFLAVHRATGLVLVAGWVTAPDGYETGERGPGLRGAGR